MPPARFAPGPPRLRVEPIFRLHRYRDLARVAPAIRDVAEQMARAAETLAAPEIVFDVRTIDRVDADAVTLLDGPTFHGRCLGTHLAEAVQAVCFVATIGPALDRRVGELAATDELLEAVFLDSAGWLAIEDALRRFRGSLGAGLRPKNLRLGPRLGPGYVDWSLAEQPRFFSVFGDATLPVTVSNDGVMSPKKSISGLFGIVARG